MYSVTLSSIWAVGPTSSTDTNKLPLAVDKVLMSGALLIIIVVGFTVAVGSMLETEVALVKVAILELRNHESVVGVTAVASYQHDVDVVIIDNFV